MLRDLTAVAIFLGVMWAAGMPEERTISLAPPRIEIDEHGNEWVMVSPVIVSPTRDAVAVLIIDPRVYVPEVEVER